MFVNFAICLHINMNINIRSAILHTWELVAQLTRQEVKSSGIQSNEQQCYKHVFLSIVKDVLFKSQGQIFVSQEHKVCEKTYFF